jgi:arsenate reductase (glutaredoxin)
MASHVLLYGIVNCDTMKKARAWLEAHQVAYEFRDYKKSAPTPALLEGWSEACGWEALLNRAGTTFRKLPESDTRHLTREKAIALMIAQPSMIKRPVLDIGGQLTIGFKPDVYARVFG